MSNLSDFNEIGGFAKVIETVCTISNRATDRLLYMFDYHGINWDCEFNSREEMIAALATKMVNDGKSTEYVFADIIHGLMGGA